MARRPSMRDHHEEVHFSRWRAWTQRFQEREVERFFVAERHARLLVNVRYCVMMQLSMSVLACLLMLSDIYLAKQNEEVAAVRILGVLLPLGLISLAVLLTSKCTWLLARMGPYGFELFCILVVLITLVFLPLLQPKIMVNFASLGVPDFYDAGWDANLALILDVYLTAVHVCLPIRWVMLLPSEFLCVLCLVVPVALSDASIKAVLYKLMLMASLSAIASFGKWQLEAYERKSFQKLVAERIKRAQAERELEVLQLKSSASGEEHGQKADTRYITAASERSCGLSASLPETTDTGHIFNRIGCSTSDEEWEDLVSLGYREHWLLAPSEVHLQADAFLGAGGFGMVQPALFHGALVAVKKPLAMGSAQARSTKALRIMAHELRIFRHLRHPNIVLFYGALIAEANTEIMLVMEYIHGTQLRDYACRRRPSMENRVWLTHQVCCALQYLHAQRPVIVHGDIKGSNVLVEEIAETPRAKLVDFGLSRLLTKHAQPLGGTLNYVAPEVILEPRCAPHTSSDVYSFGRVLYMTMSGKKPLHGLGKADIIAAAGRGALPALVCEEVQVPLLAEECNRLVADCCQTESRLRPTIDIVERRLSSWMAGPGGEEGSSDDASSKIARARLLLAQRAEGVVQVSKPGTRSAGSPAEEESEHGPLADLLVPGFMPTPEETLKMSVACLLYCWNVRPQPDACCPWHTVVQKLGQVHQQLASECCISDFSPHCGFQCPQCGLLDMGSEEGEPLECNVCGAILRAAQSPIQSL